jgi:hypothetical protein
MGYDHSLGLEKLFMLGLVPILYEVIMFPQEVLKSGQTWRKMSPGLSGIRVSRFA